MCGTCGCTGTEEKLAALPQQEARKTVEVLTGLLDANDHAAAHNRAHLKEAGVLCINLMSSPGAGKTALLEATIEALGERYRIGVIEGDLETENDAERIRSKGVPAVQICTGTACHLDAHMVHRALHEINLGELDILFIENVGNLVCPASFDLGHHRNVTLLSTTEGDDKPQKYPVMFRSADLMLVTKSDLLEILGDFDPKKAEQHLRHLANPAPFMTCSAREPATLEPWFNWLADERDAVAQGRGEIPHVDRERADLHGHHHAHAH